MKPIRRLTVALIQPSRYDDDGYVIRYFRGVLPSNTLACLRSITLEFAGRWKEERGIEITVEAFDEVVERIPIGRLARLNRGDRKIVAALVGVQSNQFARASDLAKQLTALGIKTVIGGFHVSGILSMFGEPTPEIRELMDLGVTLVHGEAEGRWESILADILVGAEKPLYVMDGYPDISEAPFPRPDRRYMKKFALPFMGTVDCSRGCPFNCNFCTVVNVQGRTMRSRSAEHVVAAIIDNYRKGMDDFFFTDDNFARNPEWEEILDGLIRFREGEGKSFTMMMQVDTRCHKIPHFIEKAARAGCSSAFIGMESINPKNIESAGKKQNRVEDYAEYIEAWHAAGVTTHVGYIIGFPYDSPASVRADITRLKNEIKVDHASFFVLTPLPGSRDHLEMVKAGTPMDADLNRFDSFHTVMDHPLMTREEWRAAYNEAWEIFYSFDALRNTLMRSKSNSQYWGLFKNIMWYKNSLLEPRHPMVAGFIRRKDRRDVRPGTAVPRFRAFFMQRVKELAGGFRKRISLFFELQELWLLTRKPDDPTFHYVAEFSAAVDEAKRRIASIDFSLPHPKWGEEMSAVIHRFRDQLNVRFDPSALKGKARKRARALLDEMNAHLEKLNPFDPTRRDAYGLSTYLTNKRAALEEGVLKFVGGRRKITGYWVLTRDRVKNGKILRFIISIPTIAFNGLRDIRMSLKFIYHLMHRNFIRHR